MSFIKDIFIFELSTVLSFTCPLCGNIIVPDKNIWDIGNKLDMQLNLFSADDFHQLFPEPS